LLRRASHVSTGPLAVSNDGGRLVAPTPEGAIGVWSIARLRREHLISRGGPFAAASFDPSGRLIAGAGKDGIGWIFDARTGGVVRRLRGHKDSLTAISFSDDGKLVVTSSLDHDARIWDEATGGLIGVLHGHYGPVLAASFSPDGRWVVTAGPVSAGVWDVSTGDVLAFLRGHTDQLTAASFSPDGSRILTASRDGTARVYVCDACGGFAELVAAANAHVSAVASRLTPEQRSRLVPDARAS